MQNIIEVISGLYLMTIKRFSIEEIAKLEKFYYSLYQEPHGTSFQGNQLQF